MKAPTKEELEGWKADPTTQAFFETLRRWSTSLKEQWGAGNFISSDSGETARMNIQAVGQVRQIEMILELDHQQIEETLKDDN